MSSYTPLLVLTLIPTVVPCPSFHVTPVYDLGMVIHIPKYNPHESNDDSDSKVLSQIVIVGFQCSKKEKMRLQNFGQLNPIVPCQFIRQFVLFRTETYVILVIGMCDDGMPKLLAR